MAPPGHHAGPSLVVHLLADDCGDGGQGGGDFIGRGRDASSRGCGEAREVGVKRMIRSAATTADGGGPAPLGSRRDEVCVRRREVPRLIQRARGLGGLKGPGDFIW